MDGAIYSVNREWRKPFKSVMKDLCAICGNVFSNKENSHQKINHDFSVKVLVRTIIYFSPNSITGSNFQKTS